MSAAKKARHLPVSPFDQCPDELIRNMIRFLDWVDADELRYTDRRCCLLASDLLNHCIFYAPKCPSIAFNYACAVIPCISNTGQIMCTLGLFEPETPAVDQVCVQSVNTEVMLVMFKLAHISVSEERLLPAVAFMSISGLEDFFNCIFSGYEAYGQFSCRQDAEEKVQAFFVAKKAERSRCGGSGESDSDLNSSDPLACAFECHHQLDMPSRQAVIAICSSVAQYEWLE
jgi:hypothetical protein